MMNPTSKINKYLFQYDDKIILFSFIKLFFLNKMILFWIEEGNLNLTIQLGTICLPHLMEDKNARKERSKKWEILWVDRFLGSSSFKAQMEK